jgi:hypothetical protein
MTGGVPGEPETRMNVGSLCAEGVRRTGTDGGGVSVVSSQGVPVLVHATDATARDLGDLQFTLGEGPRVDAVRSRTSVLVPDLVDGASPGRRWPGLLHEVQGLGVAALFAFPLTVAGVPLGTLEFYRETPGALGPDELAAGLATGAAVGRTLVQAEQDGDSSLSFPMTVHRAAGMVMVQLGTGINEALVRLRATAFVEGATITTIATEVLDGSRRFRKEDS